MYKEDIPLLVFFGGIMLIIIVSVVFQKPKTPEEIKMNLWESCVNRAIVNQDDVSTCNSLKS